MTYPKTSLLKTLLLHVGLYFKVTLVTSLSIAVGLGIYYGYGEALELRGYWGAISFVLIVIWSLVITIVIFPFTFLFTCIPYIILMLIMRVVRLNHPIWYVVCALLVANVFPTYIMFSQDNDAIALGVIIYLSALIVGIKMHDMDFINTNKAPALEQIYRWFRGV